MNSKVFFYSFSTNSLELTRHTTRGSRWSLWRPSWARLTCAVSNDVLQEGECARPEGGQPVTNCKLKGVKEVENWTYACLSYNHTILAWHWCLVKHILHHHSRHFNLVDYVTFVLSIKILMIEFHIFGVLVTSIW